MAATEDKRQAVIDGFNALSKAFEAFILDIPTGGGDTGGGDQREKCERGPSIENVSVRGDQLIELRFDGSKVETAAVVVKDPSGLIINKVEDKVMTSNTFSVELLRKLSPGVFEVRMVAVNCIGESVFYLTVAGDNTGDCTAKGEITSVTLIK